MPDLETNSKQFRFLLLDGCRGFNAVESTVSIACKFGKVSEKLEEFGNGKGKLANASEEGQGPRRAVEPMMMM
jgi:hypothetical protein